MSFHVAVISPPVKVGEGGFVPPERYQSNSESRDIDVAPNEEHVAFSLGRGAASEGAKTTDGLTRDPVSGVRIVCGDTLSTREREGGGGGGGRAHLESASLFVYFHFINVVLNVGKLRRGDRRERQGKGLDTNTSKESVREGRRGGLGVCLTLVILLPVSVRHLIQCSHLKSFDIWLITFPCFSGVQTTMRRRRRRTEVNREEGDFDFDEGDGRGEREEVGRTLEGRIDGESLRFNILHGWVLGQRVSGGEGGGFPL